MNFQKKRIMPIVAVSIAVCIGFYSAQQTFSIHPQNNSYTELWLLGPQHTVENYPLNITSNTTYSMFLCIANHLGSASTYQIQVKLRNSTQSAANHPPLTPSELPSIQNITTVVADDETWELPVTVSFDYVHIPDQNKVAFKSLGFNGDVLSIETYTVSSDSERSGYFENLIFELWVLNETTGFFEYNHRYVGVWFNMQP